MRKNERAADGFVAPQNHYAKWTDEERKIIQEHWADLPSAKIAEAFPGRTLKAVQAQAEKMHLKKSPARIQEMARDTAIVRWQQRKKSTEPGGPAA